MNLTGLIVSSPRGDTARAFVVDLKHPVRGDIGKPLGVIRVDGHFRGRFVPSESDTSELAPAGVGFDGLLAHANTDWDEQQHSLAETPIGAVVSLYQINLSCYINDINGVPHVLQMGPQPFYHYVVPGALRFMVTARPWARCLILTRAIGLSIYHRGASVDSLKIEPASRTP